MSTRFLMAGAQKLIITEPDEYLNRCNCNNIDISRDVTPYRVGPCDLHSASTCECSDWSSYNDAAIILLIRGITNCNRDKIFATKQPSRSAQKNVTNKGFVCSNQQFTFYIFRHSYRNAAPTVYLQGELQLNGDIWWRTNRFVEINRYDVTGSEN